MAHWYAPFVHTELPAELAKLRQADQEQALDFARTYGELGFSSLAGTWEQATHLDLESGQRSTGGDPLPWIRAHASGVYVCLAVAHALTTPKLVTRKFLDDFNGWPYARQLRAEIINRNVTRIYRYVSVDDKGRDRTFFQFRARVDVAYWHLANALDGGTLKRCSADGCSGIFIQTDPRQRYCPKRWRQRESSCAMRQRQRDARR
jgi:hypothetical protein